MSRKHGRNELDPRLIAALARGVSHTQAAIETGVSTKTIQRRLKRDEFRSAVSAARSAMLAEATGKLAAATSAAVDTLSALAANATSELVRASCARSILELAGKFRESEEFERRLSELESRSCP